MCVCVYHLGSFIQVITGQDLQRTGSDQSFGVVYSRPLRFKKTRLRNLSELQQAEEHWSVNYPKASMKFSFNNVKEPNVP